MPALTADIAAGTRSAKIETWENPAIKVRYPRARDGSNPTSEGFFDLASNAVTALVARAALIGVERRRFRVVVSELIWPSPAGGIPTVTLIDPENNVSAAAMVSRVEVRLADETTVFELFV